MSVCGHFKKLNNSTHSCSQVAPIWVSEAWSLPSHRNKPLGVLILSICDSFSFPPFFDALGNLIKAVKLLPTKCTPSPNKALNFRAFLRVSEGPHWNSR